MLSHAGAKSLRRLVDAVLTVSSGLDLGEILKRIVEVAAELVEAQYAALGVLDESRTRLAQFITVGLTDEQRQAIGALPHGHGILGLLILDAKPVRLPDLTEHPDSYGFPIDHPPMTSFLGVPIRVRDEVFGNLYLTDKVSGDSFTDVDEELAVALAGAAGVAIENARLHGQLQDMRVLEDQERIARDLHDSVIQRLFATGLSLQAAARLSHEPPVAERIERAVDDIDATVREIRTVIFGLEPVRMAGGGLRERVLAVVREAARPLGFEPRVVFDGPVDTVVGEAAAADAVATLREALSNVARHAAASSVDVSVSALDKLVVEVADDGVGPPGPDAPLGDGVRNMRQRAAARGGDMEFTAGSPRGTVVRWTVPVD